LWGLGGEVRDNKEAWGLFIGSLRRFGQRKIGGGARRRRRCLGPAGIPVVGRRDDSGRATRQLGRG
jgi:hypothetical protein